MEENRVAPLDPTTLFKLRRAGRAVPKSVTLDLAALKSFGWIYLGYPCNPKRLIARVLGKLLESIAISSSRVACC